MRTAPSLTSHRREERLWDRALAARRAGLAEWYGCPSCGAAWFSRDHVAWNGPECPTCQVGVLAPMERRA